MDRRVARAERETARAEIVLPPGEAAAALAVARRLGCVVFSIVDDGSGKRRLAFEPPAERWALAYAVDPSGAMMLGPSAPSDGRESEGDATQSGGEGSNGATGDAALAAREATQRHRRRTMERLQRRAATIATVPRVAESDWSGIDRLVPEVDRRTVRAYALSGVPGKAVADRLLAIVARELQAMDSSATSQE